MQRNCFVDYFLIGYLFEKIGIPVSSSEIWLDIFNKTSPYTLWETFLSLRKLLVLKNWNIWQHDNNVVFSYKDPRVLKSSVLPPAEQSFSVSFRAFRRKRCAPEFICWEFIYPGEYKAPSSTPRYTVQAFVSPPLFPQEFPSSTWSKCNSVCSEVIRILFFVRCNRAETSQESETAVSPMQVHYFNTAQLQQFLRREYFIPREFLLWIQI